METNFGREGSPVTYINPPCWTHQASNYDDGEKRKYTDDEQYRMLHDIGRGPAELGPDELGIDGIYGVRARWD